MCVFIMTGLGGRRCTSAGKCGIRRNIFEKMIWDMI